MKKENFIELYGNEEMKVTSNYATKSLGPNYNIVDTAIEFCDNAFDARFDNTSLNFTIEVNRNEHTITFHDNGRGVADAEKLIILGGTDKENRNDAIGKFGVGIEGATSSIATQCAYDPDEVVEVIFESSREGRHFEKHIAFDNSGEQINGTTQYSDAINADEHYTKITFTNVVLSDEECKNICMAMESTFEEPLQKHLNISIIVDGNTRVLGKSLRRTFVGDESVSTVKVGDFNVDVKYRIIGGDEQNARNFEESGIRIYDKKSGRLLAKSNRYWKWYAGREAQQNICGLRCGIYIDSSIECYKKFGVSPTKNGIGWKDYYKMPDFAELKDELGGIYTKASGTKPTNSEGEIVIGSKTFNVSGGKMATLYSEVEGANIVVMKKKYSNMEIATLIAENIALKKKVEKKNKRTKA